MTIRAELADGTVLEFPDNTPDDVIDATVQRVLAERQSSQPHTVQERARQVFGFEDLAERGTILPLGRTQEGELVLATPQIGVDIAESVLLPGHVAQGGEFTPEDVTRFALDVAVPATAGRGVGAAPRPVRRGVSRRQMVREAPTTEQLRTRAVGQREAASQAGVVVNPDKFADLAV